MYKDNHVKIPNTIKCCEFKYENNFLRILTTPYCNVNTHSENSPIINRVKKYEECKKGKIFL